MFEHHFGLRENPFAPGHHAKFVYPSPEHQEALAHLRYGIENREPFVLITGEVGTGKTTALYDALGEWQSRVEVALITNSALTQQELIEEIALRFGAPVSGPASKPQMLAHLERLLGGIFERGDRAIVLLDEAQNLERELLEEIRLLSNLERDGIKLIQVFLVGQPELEARLQKNELRQLRQRITVQYRLQPLSAEDTEHYIHHRIHAAGGNGATIFPAKACREVHRITHGIPREINTLCSQALLTAFVDDARAVAPAHVTSAAAEIEFKSVMDREAPDETASLPPLATSRTIEAPATGAAAVPKRGPKSESASAPPAPSPAASKRPAAEPPSHATKKPKDDLDLDMIESWMAELNESKVVKPVELAAPSVTPRPIESAKPVESVKPIETPKPVVPEEWTRRHEPAAPVSGSAVEGAPARSSIARTAAAAEATPSVTRRSFADEGRGAGDKGRGTRDKERGDSLPPRLKDKMKEDEYGDEEFLKPSSGSRWVAIAIVLLLVAVGGALVLRYGPWSAKPAPAGGTKGVANGEAVVPGGGEGASATGSAAGGAEEVGPTTPATEGSTVASGTEAGVAATPHASAAKPVASESAPTEAAPAEKPAPKGSFGLAVATYLDRDRAEEQRAKFAESTHLTASVREVAEGGSSVYRIVIGDFESRGAAESGASDLISKGLVEEARVVANPRLKH